MNAQRRAIGWRIGVTALNLLGFGLGLLRVGRVRAGWIALVLPIALMVGPALLVAAGTPAPRVFTGAILAVVGGTVATYIWAIVATWRASTLIATPRAFWSRWYGVLIAGVVMSGAAWGVVFGVRLIYQPFFVPSLSMAPTFRAGDQLWANMRGGRNPRIGDIVLAQSPNGEMRIVRIAALAGDRFAVRAGVPVRNGVAAMQRADGNASIAISDVPTKTARRLVERLPGETGTHHVLDLGRSAGDDFAEMRIPAGHVFLLGDNRDRAADSRFGASEFGLGTLPLASIRGEPIAYSWTAGARFGTRPR